MGSEYAAVRDGAVLVEHRERAVVAAQGRDPVRMLQGLITNDLAALGDGQAVYGTVLTPKGRMIADVHVLRRGDGLILLTARGALAGLLAHLGKFVPPLFARFEDESAGWQVLGVYGERAAEVLGAVWPGIGRAAVDPGTVSRFDGVLILGSAAAGLAGAEVLVEPGAGGAVRERLVEAGAVPAPAEVFDVLRIEAGTPVWGAELTEDRIPLEAGLRERAISESKGCYTGQEVIIRILHRGHVNWLLRGLRLGDGAVPPAGAVLVREDGKEVARVTSAVWSARFQEVVALGYVRREVEPGTRLRVAEGGGRAGEVVALPFG